METPKISLHALAIKSGLLTFSCLIAYFLFMKYMNLTHIIELRALNFIILSGGILFAYRSYKATAKKNIDYLQGLILGCYVSAISTILFALFAGLYFSVIDPLLLIQLQDSAPMLGAYITPMSAAGTIIIEGMLSGLIISFSLMQYFQNDETHV